MFTTMMGVLLALAFVGLIVYLLETYVIKSDPFRIVMRVVVVIFLIIWLIYYFGPKIDQMLSR